jgi:hypothetical protein
MGYTLEDMAEDHRVGVAFGLFRKDLFLLVAGTIYERVLDLEKFGIRFRYEDSKAPGQFRIVDHIACLRPSTSTGILKPTLTKEAKARRPINRLQMTDCHD